MRSIPDTLGHPDAAVLVDVDVGGVAQQRRRGPDRHFEAVRDLEQARRQVDRVGQPHRRGGRTLKGLRRRRQEQRHQQQNRQRRTRTSAHSSLQLLIEARQDRAAMDGRSVDWTGDIMHRHGWRPVYRPARGLSPNATGRSPFAADVGIRAAPAAAGRCVGHQRAGARRGRRRSGLSRDCRAPAARVAAAAGAATAHSSAPRQPGPCRLGRASSTS